VSLTTQGFYDDNINTQPNKVGSWGAFINPSVDYAQVWDTSTLTLGAGYGAYYYANAKEANISDWSQTFNLDAGFKHNFNPRISLDLADNFQVFQNASQVLLGQTGRIEGNNLGNNGTADLSIELTPRFSLVLGYQNVLYKYEEDQYAATLDRMENYGKLDLRYLWLPTTVAVVGGKIGSIDYNSGLPLYFPIPEPFSPNSDIKNNRTYFAYGGFDHSFNPSLTGSLRAGVQVQDFTNLDIDKQVNPYLDVSLTYAYSAGSKATFGIIHRANPTDVTGFSLGNPVLEQESTAIYANVSHAITAKLTGSLVATFQSSQFIGGSYDGQNEEWWSAGATLSYAFTKNLSASFAYYYDLLNSDVNVNGNYYRDYNRNRVFFGVTASY
jgi:hypothetical protein